MSVSFSLHLTGEFGCCGADNISLEHDKNGNVFFSVMSRVLPRTMLLSNEDNVKLSVISSYVKEIDRFVDKGTLI